MTFSAKKILLIVVSIIILFIIAYAVFYRTKPKDVIPQSDVQAVTVSSLDYHLIPKTVTSYGQIVSPVSTAIKAQASGLITSLNFTPGQAVTPGQLLFTLNNSDSSEQLKKLQAQMQLSRQMYLRLQRLSQLAPGDISTVDVLRAKLQYQQDWAQYQQAQAIDQVKSPIAGVVTETDLAVGDYVNAGDTLVKVIDPHSLQVRYSLPSRYASLVRQGQAVMFTPTNSNQSYEAVVSYIAPEINEDAVGIMLRANMIKTQGLLANRFGQVTQWLDKHYRTLVVPQTLVQSDSQGFYVYLLRDHKVWKQYFDVGEVTASGLIEVVSGLKPNDALITANPRTLTEGQIVKVSQS